MRKIHGVRGGRLAFLLLWIVSAVLLTFQLWLPEYRHSAAGVRAVRLVICAQVAAALGFHVLACIRRDFLGTFNAFLRRHKLLTAQASLLFMSALLFICGLISLAGSAGIEDAFNLAALGRRSFLTLSALYLMGRGLPDRTQLNRCLPWRLAQAIVLCLLSKLLFGGFAAAFYVSIFFAVGDFLALLALPGTKRSPGLWAKVLAGCVLPVLLCIGTSIGFKAVFQVEILDWQIRMLCGIAPHCYSLGGFAEALRESGSRGYLLLLLYVCIAVCTSGFLLIALRSCLNRLQRNAVVLLGSLFVIMVLIAATQYILHAELLTRLLPFAAFDCVLLTAFLGNSVLINCEMEKDNEDA